MKKPRLDAIEYIRGVSMLGVVAIHVAAQYILYNATPNIHLVTLFDIFTRFSIPIFFFISAFGLFYNLDIKKPFGKSEYKNFLIRRGKTVVVPYIVWSLFYTIHSAMLFDSIFNISISSTAINLFFGNCNYQLYFMVLLIWFYLFMPLWIVIVKWCNTKRLFFLFLLQLIINFTLQEKIQSYNMEPSILKLFLDNRLNYWIVYYYFIFVLGGYLAVNIDFFHNLMKTHRTTIVILFLSTMLWLVGYSYKLFYFDHYTPLECVYTAHQLSTPGIFYTVVASIFFFTIFTYRKFPDFFCPILSVLGKNSYFMYLAHPVSITYSILCLQKFNIVLTAPITIALFLLVVIITLLLALGFKFLGNYLPIINELTIGVYPKK